MMIELIDVSGGYRGKPCIQNITATFARGSITSILGLNGYGKSTLLKLACRQLTPYAGKILVDGKNIRSIPRKKLATQISYLPQNRNMPHTTVETLVLHGRFPYLGYPRIYQKADLLLAEKAMATVGIMHLRHSYLSEVSGGERQKAYMAMLLAQDTDAVFLDEPSTFLDISHQLEMLRLIQALRDEGKAVVMVSHDLNAALLSSDRLLLLEEGKMMGFGPPHLFLENGVLEQLFGVTISPCQDATGKLQYLFTK